MWVGFATSHYATLPPLNEAGKSLYNPSQNVNVLTSNLSYFHDPWLFLLTTELIYLLYISFFSQVTKTLMYCSSLFIFPQSFKLSNTSLPSPSTSNQTHSLFLSSSNFCTLKWLTRAIKVFPTFSKMKKCKQTSKTISSKDP